ncbi:unnamed protein product, partial [marine sediment metagenome]
MAEEAAGDSSWEASHLDHLLLSARVGKKIRVGSLRLVKYLTV